MGFPFDVPLYFRQVLCRTLFTFEKPFLLSILVRESPLRIQMPPRLFVHVTSYGCIIAKVKVGNYSAVSFSEHVHRFLPLDLCPAHKLPFSCAK